MTWQTFETVDLVIMTIGKLFAVFWLVCSIIDIKYYLRKIEEHLTTLKDREK